MERGSRGNLFFRQGAKLLRMFYRHDRIHQDIVRAVASPAEQVLRVFPESDCPHCQKFWCQDRKERGRRPDFYFDEAGDPKNIGKFKNVLDCGLAMGMASGTLNAKMLGENLPPVKYRISAEYGQVSIARSKSSQSDDLFGPAMNICAKINPLARPNGLLIGQNLYEVVRGLDEYIFAVELSSSKGSYSAYHVDAEEQKDVINPFEKRALY